MKDATRKLLEKAERALAAGADALRSGHVETAAGRAYYAMFYVAEALLSERGLRFRKHAGVHAAFGEHFAKTGLLDARHHRWLLAAFNKRITADYGIDPELTSAEAAEMLAHGVEFLDVGRRFIEAGSAPANTSG